MVQRHKGNIFEHFDVETRRESACLKASLGTTGFDFNPLCNDNSLLSMWGFTSLAK